MKHLFEDYRNMNILNWKINRKINSIKTWRSWKAEFLIKNYVIFDAKIWMRKSRISNPKYFIYLSCSWRVLVLIFFSKIMGGNYVFSCSNHVSFNPTSHLNSWESLVVDTEIFILVALGVLDSPSVKSKWVSLISSI